MAIKTDTFTVGAGGVAVTSVNTQTGVVVLSGDDIAADHTASNYTAANANIDGHLSGIDTKLGTIAAGLTYKGTFDASTGTPSIANGLQGDLYIIDTAGTIYGQTWAVGDHLLINEDMGGTITNSKIDKIDNTDQVTSVNGDTGTVTVDLQSVTDEGAETTANVIAGGIRTPNLRVGPDALNNYYFPTSDGTLRQVLATNGVGSLFFSDTVREVNGQNDVVTLSGDDIAADHTAVNYTAANANVDGHLSGIDSKLGTVGGAASETSAGIIEIATNAEAAAGTATDKAIVPSNVSSLDLNAMDNTTSNFISDITGESLNDLSDVSFTAGAGIDNYVLTYDNGTSSWGAEIVPSAPVTSVNTLTGAVVVSGDDIAADHTAVNYTAANANIDGHLSGVDTKLGTLLSDITGESLNDLSDVSFTAGAGIDNYVLTYDNGTSSWGAEAAPTAAAASETVAGVVELATNAEAAAGTATDKAIVPSNVSSLDLNAMDNTTAGFISDVVSDTTPQLGGSLDVNGQDIVSASNGDIEIAPNGTGSTVLKGNATGGSGHIKFNCEQNSHAVTIKGPAHSAFATYTLTLPTTDGDADQVLKTDGTGVLSWVDQPAGASPASETVAGVVELATNAEAAAGTATDKAIVPSNVSSLDLSDMDNTTSAFIALSDIPTASHSTAGILETATNAEATSASANDKIITPANLSHIDLSTFDNDTGFISDITGESLNDLSDVSFTAGAGIDNYVLTYDNGTSSWGAEAVPTAAAASETVAGVIEIATNAEAAAGTATDKAIVPSNVSSLDLSTMDNTTAGFISDITSESLNDLSDVSFTAGAGIDNYVLTYDNGTSTWGAEAIPGAAAPSVTSQNTTATLSAPSAGTLEEVYTVNSTSAVTLTLVSAATVGEGFKYQLKRLGTGAVTIDPAGSEYIDHSGQSTFSIGSQYDSITLISDGTNWLLI